jgi:hypothetical protein
MSPEMVAAYQNSPQVYLAAPPTATMSEVVAAASGATGATATGMNPDAPAFKFSEDALKQAVSADAKELIATRAREVLVAAEKRKQENKAFQERM